MLLQEWGVGVLPKVPPQDWGLKKYAPQRVEVLPLGMTLERVLPQEWGAGILPPGLHPRIGAQKICSPKNREQRFYLQELGPRKCAPLR